LELGNILANKYTLKRLLGQGANAKTYLCKDPENNQVVAKVLDFKKLDDWKVFELFQREVSVLRNLDYPFIPNYIDNFENKTGDESIFVLVQEYVEGQNLYSYIKSGKKLNTENIKNILNGILEILGYIHNLSPPVIHRDINPKNIIIDKNLKPHLVDFGSVGNFVKDTISAAMSSTFVGTIGYMPPEQLFGKALPATDIYSLGITILYILTGKEPSEFEFKNLKLDIKNCNIPDDLEDIINVMIEPDIDKRVESAVDVINLLKSGKGLKENNIKSDKIGVAFHFNDDEEAYTLEEFEKFIKKGIIKGSLSVEIMDFNSKFFKNADAWFKNYLDASYHAFFWEKISKFIEDNYRDIYYKKVCQSHKHLKGKYKEMIKAVNIRLGKEKKNKRAELKTSLAADNNEKKKKFTKFLFKTASFFIFTAAVFAVVYSISFRPSRLHKGESVFNLGMFIPIFVNAVIWLNVLGSFISGKIADFVNSKRTVKITDSLKDKIDEGFRQIDDVINKEYQNSEYEVQRRVFNSLKKY
jgi:serine/threonine protein kinase